ncbi:calcium/sodium antiporter [Ruegeria sediminis]|uniref:Calcium/sodium antiporter n=1 Tax=Ruegeria sediminis TaxID=2583820 RepID=A0ABY2WV28_9RHOB|nr:calcium/sodium antiporter [Ruegeria sediminis]TMV06458.1 calcium/sodium antiporter [Ruegeria sediminis]
MTILLFLIGLAALFVGGDLLLRGAVSTARSLRVSDLVIGMTVIGFGTSLPELLVSVQAAWTGAPGIALGNVIGSNIANILLILGAAALLFPVAAQFVNIRRDLLMMLAATVALWLLIADGRLGRAEGTVLVIGLAAFLWFSLRQSDPLPASAPADPARFKFQSAAQLGVGLALLIIGARLLVDSATTLARDAGISEAVVGLTIVAIGTSLPELATSLMAAWRRNASVALGNVIGSNLFNILGIMGLTAVIAPVTAQARFATLDMPIALATAGILVLLLWRSQGIGRVGGAMLFGGYLFYLIAIGA